jgi:hypothetical protein
MATLEPPLIAGKAFTVTVTAAVLTQPFEFVPVTVYVLVVVGLAVTLLQVVQDKPVAGLHV